MGLKIRYVDFWPGFKPEEFLFTRILEKISGSRVELISKLDSQVDLQINSVFCFKSSKDKALLRAKSFGSKNAARDYQSRVFYGHRLNHVNRARKYIWYTGENKRSPLEDFDYTIGFDKSDPSSNHLYFPYWMTRIDWGFGSSEYEIMPRWETLMETRKPECRPLSACTFSTALELNRERVVRALERVIPVSKYGYQYGNPAQSKIETSRKFGLQVCLENQMSPGYVTEKLHEAWIARNVPIWAGLHATNHFNSEAYFDVTSMNQEEIIGFFEKVTLEQIHDMQTKPILKEQPTIYDLTHLLERAIS